MAHVVAPWTDRQVLSLNGFQQRSYNHPFTCPAPQDDHDGDEVLVAHPDGWRCPQPRCAYRQMWAHDFMADHSWELAANEVHRLFTTIRIDAVPGE